MSIPLNNMREKYHKLGWNRTSGEIRFLDYIVKAIDAIIV